MIFGFQDSDCHAKELIYCEIFVMTQCSVSLTVAHVVEFGERKWENICESEFNKLSAGKLRQPVYVMLIRLN